MAAPVIVIHGGAGDEDRSLRSRELTLRASLLAALGRAHEVLAGGGDALDAAQAAVACMEDEADHLNAGRGSVLCSDGTVEMSAGAMRGVDRAAGAVAGVRRVRLPSAAARLVLDSEHVLMIGSKADAWAAAGGLEQREPAYFATDGERARLRRHLGASGGAPEAGGGGAPEAGGGTVGAVCLDMRGQLAACTSTGGLCGQPPGRVGDTPVIGAGTWADGRVAVSCTGQGEAFIRAGVSRQIAALVAADVALGDAATRTLADVISLGGGGGLIAVDVNGAVVTPFTTAVMPRGIWRAGSDPEVALGAGGHGELCARASAGK